MHLESKWIRVYLIYLSFYVFDFISTSIFCSNPNQEQGPLPRVLMQLTGNVLYGLILNLSVNITIWGLAMFFILPRLNDFAKDKYAKNYRLFLLVVFIPLGYSPSIEFWAATSWYWHIADEIRTSIGYLLYLLSFLWVKPFS